MDTTNKTVAPTVKDRYTMFAPFFEATRASGSSKFVTYDCVFCTKSVEPETVAARSFTGIAVTWAHTDCLRQIPGATVSTDRNAKRKAHEAFKERQAVARKAARAAAEPTVSLEVATQEIEASVRTRIEAEYEDRMVRAVALIERLQADLKQAQAALTDENLTDQGRSDAAAVTEPTPVKRGPGRPRKNAA